MEGSLSLKGLLILGVGLLSLWWGISGWRHRREERISMIEAAILKATNAEPLPLNSWDRAIAYALPILMLLFAPIFIFLGLVLLFG
jgi:hypothetical protein